MAKVYLEELTDDVLRRIAWVIGEGAASQAIRFLAERRARGEDAVCYWDRRRETIIVGPRMTQQ
jgi:hypothetical protein